MTDRRIYPVKNPDVVTRQQADFLAKIEKNKKSGLEAFSSGEYRTFQGYSIEEEKRRFLVILELDDPSVKEINRRVIDPLERLSQVHNISAVFAGRGDQPPHVTLQLGRMSNLSEDEMRRIDQWLKSGDSHLSLLTNILTGLQFHHDTLVTAPNTYIGASKFDPEQGAPFRARTAIEKMMNEALSTLNLSPEKADAQFKPPHNYLDIFYTSVMRLSGKPPIDNLLAFSNAANYTVGKSLEENPLPVTVGGVFKGTSFDFINARVPDLLR